MKGFIEKYKNSRVLSPNCLCESLPRGIYWKSFLKTHTKQQAFHVEKKGTVDAEAGRYTPAGKWVETAQDLRSGVTEEHVQNALVQRSSKLSWGVPIYPAINCE